LPLGPLWLLMWPLWQGYESELFGHVRRVHGCQASSVGRFEVRYQRNLVSG
jgi:hypothetical protein